MRLFLLLWLSTLREYTISTCGSYVYGIVVALEFICVLFLFIAIFCLSFMRACVLDLKFVSIFRGKVFFPGWAKIMGLSFMY